MQNPTTVGSVSPSEGGDDFIPFGVGLGELKLPKEVEDSLFPPDEFGIEKENTKAKEKETENERQRKESEKYLRGLELRLAKLKALSPEELQQRREKKREEELAKKKRESKILDKEEKVEEFDNNNNEDDEEEFTWGMTKGLVVGNERKVKEDENKTKVEETEEEAEDYRVASTVFQVVHERPQQQSGEEGDGDELGEPVLVKRIDEDEVPLISQSEDNEEEEKEEEEEEIQIRENNTGRTEEGISINIRKAEIYGVVESKEEENTGWAVFSEQQDEEGVKSEEYYNALQEEEEEQEDQQNTNNSDGEDDAEQQGREKCI